ncbi:hypothetical protein [Desulfobulbus alkaliphilus]|uniref:hypothetical protein n=1 Tax=Desulfobulbus alkaliphilus TaxID=869814 RepID=UPI0019649280|nr:hypothetical protein [Desulfobulbus alkaliphilus]MBM9536895.1 hypothetical protein [Desulfobulbus alkaliphilus]
MTVKNPTALIRSRISEKRIFEAGFLCRQLGTEIDPREKTALQQELDSLVARVDELRQQARAHAQEGRRTRADSVYRDIEGIAIDVPGLQEERAKLVGAEPLVARITGRTHTPEPEPATKPDEPMVKAEQREVEHEPAGAFSQVSFNGLARGRMIVLGSVGVLFLVALVVLVALFRGVQPPVLTEPEEGDQAILIRPLTLPPSDTATVIITEIGEESSDDSTVSGDSTVAKPVDRPPTVSVGTLQIEETAR